MHNLYTLRWINPLLDLYKKEKKHGTLESINEIVEDFIRYHFDSGMPHHWLFKGDHVVAERLAFLADYLRVLKEDRASENTIENVKRLFNHDMTLALGNEIYRPKTNHGAMLDISVLYATLTLPETDPEGKYFHFAQNRFKAQIENIFTKTGVTKEHSIAYQIYNMHIIAKYLSTLKKFKKHDELNMAESLRACRSFWLTRSCHRGLYL